MISYEARLTIDVGHSGPRVVGGQMESVVSSKGQVVIPAAIRKHLGIVAGTHLEFAEVGGQIVVTKVMTDDPVARAFGCVPHRSGAPATTDSWLAELRDRPL